ncbi:TonB-dependent receptor [Hyphomonas sp.]|uniref:TonB-dependent receptor n=1 Tax=Hyphomonas sp. TaxID=87 RepID=UPI0025C4AF98|nr:TonB-dependent receptor [Hyphomonas sp.]
MRTVNWRFGLAAILAVIAPPALAQDAPSAEDELAGCEAVTNPPCACSNSCEAPAEEISVLPRRLSPVEVWGDRRPTDPGSQSALSGALVAETAADHPAEILNQAPGVNVQMNSGQEHLIAIRSPVLTGGAGQGSFLVLENGVPARSPAFGNVNSLIEPHFEVASEIEVVRGPGSAKYGSNAVHGLINVFLPLPSDEQFVRGSYSTLDRWRGDASVNLTDNTRLNLSLLDDKGWRDETGALQQKLSLTDTRELAGWDVTAWLSASNLNQETASFIQGPRAYEDRDLAETNPNPEAFRDAWSARGAIRLQRMLGPGRLTLAPNLHSQGMVFSQHFLPYGGIEKNAHTGGGLMARYDFDASGPFIWRFGADTDFATGYLKEVQPIPHPSPAFPQGVHYNYSVDTQVAALWGELEYQLSPTFLLVAGLRGEMHDYTYDTRAPAGINGRFNVPADRTDDFAFTAPKLGLVWDREWYSLYANYARGGRAPQVSDLYRLQFRQVAGEIEAETLDSVEIGVRGDGLFGHLDFDIAAYWMEKENFFFRDSDGLNVVDGSTRHKGIEAAATLRIDDRLSLGGNVAWSDQTYTFDRLVIASQQNERIAAGNAIDTAPEWLADARLDWQAFDALKLSLTVEHVGEYFMDPANTVTYPGHTVLGARAAWDWQDDLQLWINLRNLTDEAYADRADVGFGNERYFPGEPLNATFGLTRKF